MRCWGWGAPQTGVPGQEMISDASAAVDVETGGAVVDLATAKLEEHGRQDMAAALDKRDGAHNRGSIDGRARATRPKSVTELNSRWRGVATCDGRALQFALPADDTATGLDPSGGGAG